MMRRETLIGLVSVALLGGCNRASQERPSSGNEISSKPPDVRPPQDNPAPDAAELQLDYAILLDKSSVPTLVPRDYHFHSGDRFRIRLRPQFAAYVYLLNRGDKDDEYSFLFPHQQIPQTNPVPSKQTVTLPGEEWYTLDKTSGQEHLVLLVCTQPVKEFTDSKQSPGHDDFETRLAVLERDRRPASSRQVKDGEWVKLFASYKDDAVLVVRLPLDHS